jgi:hypothetical protein
LRIGRVSIHTMWVPLLGWSANVEKSWHRDLLQTGGAAAPSLAVAGKRRKQGGSGAASGSARHGAGRAFPSRAPHGERLGRVAQAVLDDAA